MVILAEVLLLFQEILSLSLLRVTFVMVRIVLQLFQVCSAVTRTQALFPVVEN